MEPFDQLHAVSDLHLGGEPGHQIFDQGVLLAALIDTLRTRPAELRIALVLNGDIVDFLAGRDAAYLDPLGAVRKLEAVFADPAFRPVWDALARFVRTDRRVLVLAAGNHDVELALPSVGERLVAEICGDDAAARGRVRMAMDGTGWACTVGGRKALCVHGNEVDPWNVVDSGALRAQIKAERQGTKAPVWEPNAGTRLVIDVMNGVKQSFPLVDLLKPEVVPVVGVLLAVDPTALAALTRFAPIAVRLSWDAMRLQTGLLASAIGEPLDGEAALEQLLASTSTRSVAAPITDDWLRGGQAHFAAGTDALMLTPERAEARQLGRGRGRASSVLQAFEKRSPQSNLRLALARWLAGDTTFAVDTEDDTSKQLDAATGADVFYLVAGHTHLARALVRREHEGFYFNSGTWIRLIRLTDAALASDAAFAPVFEAFRARSLEALDDTPGLVLRVPTVVSIETEPGASTVVAGLYTAALLDGGGARLDLLAGSRFESPKVSG